MPEAQRHVAHANRRFQRRPSWNRSVVSVPLCSICPDPALSYLASVVFEPLCSICPDTALLFLDSCALVMLYPCGLALVFERLASVAMEPLRSMSPDSALPFWDSVEYVRRHCVITLGCYRSRDTSELSCLAAAGVEPF